MAAATVLLTVVRVLCVLYIAVMLFCFLAMYRLCYPSSCSSGEQCLKSYLAETPQPQIKMLVYSSTSPSANGSDLYLVWELNNFNPNEDFTKDVTVNIPLGIHNNGSMFVHVFLAPVEGGEENPYDADWEVHQTEMLTTYISPQPTGLQVIGDNSVPVNQTLAAADHLTCHWRSHLKLNVVVSDVKVDMRALPGKVSEYIRPYKDQYLPTLVIDDITYKTEDLLPLNKTCKEMPLTITYKPVSFSKFQVWNFLKVCIKSEVKYNEDKDEKDSVVAKYSLLDKFPVIFLQCILVLFQLLFYFLSVESDIRFWKNRSTMGGLSTQAVVWHSISCLVVFLHLVEEKSCLFVQHVFAIFLVVEVWKLFKVFQVRVCWTEWRLTFENVGFGNRERETEAHDAQAMKWLSFVLYQSWIAVFIYTVMNNPEKSWYSLCILSLYNGFYYLDFVYILPQFYINYKLKSVSDLPWTVLMFEAAACIIMYICRFIIMMPVGESALREILWGVIKAIYFYQRWLYHA